MSFLVFCLVEVSLFCFERSVLTLFRRASVSPPSPGLSPIFYFQCFPFTQVCFTNYCEYCISSLFLRPMGVFFWRSHPHVPVPILYIAISCTHLLLKILFKIPILIGYRSPLLWWRDTVCYIESILVSIRFSACQHIFQSVVLLVLVYNFADFHQEVMGPQNPHK